MKVRANQIVNLYDHSTDTWVTLTSDRYYDPADPLVKANRWAFSTDDELAAVQSEGPRTEVVIETATAEPGRRRSTRR